MSFQCTTESISINIESVSRSSSLKVVSGLPRSYRSRARAALGVMIEGLPGRGLLTPEDVF